MFRLRDAHVQLRRALFDRNAEAAWEHVNRQTRQEAGLLAAHIRKSFEELTEAEKEQLRKKLGTKKDANILAIQGQDLLVAPFFLEAHPHLLAGEREDAKLKDHGTKMAGPTGVVVHKKTAEEIIVPYTFTTEGHFGGQAMDYRAQLSFPALNDILGPVPKPQTLSEVELARRTVEVFQQAQNAFLKGDVEALWPLLDCDSQSQAHHFVDQAKERSANHPEIAELLSLSDAELAELNGKKVWLLAWSKADLAYFAEAINPRYVSAADYDPKLVPIPTDYKRRDRPCPEAMIEFESQGRTWQIPARVNYRSGSPEITLFLKTPFYQRLRGK